MECLLKIKHNLVLSLVYSVIHSCIHFILQIFIEWHIMYMIYGYEKFRDEPDNVCCWCSFKKILVYFLVFNSEHLRQHDIMKKPWPRGHKTLRSSPAFMSYVKWAGLFRSNSSTKLKRIKLSTLPIAKIKLQKW